MPNGFSGVLTGGAIVFFTYIGFDAVSTAAEECHNPQRDMPRGILITLAACAILYAARRAGAHGHRALGHAQQRRSGGERAQSCWDYNRLRFVVTVGALLGMIVSLLVGQYGQARIWFAMSRDRLLPGAVLARASQVSRRRMSAPGSRASSSPSRRAFWDIGTFGDLTNIGTLFAFVVVSAGVIILRRTQPDHPRGFRVPWVPFLPLLSIVCCLVLMLSLPLETWIRFVVWLIIGLADLFPLQP